MPRKQVPLLDRFLAKVRINSETGCWEWTATKSRLGYGSFNVGGGGFGKTGAHRASYEIYCGPIPNGMSVLHRCDNRSCVNAEHLFLGTQADNISDMISKGRHSPGRVCGEAVGGAKLTRADVLAIRAAEGIGTRTLAKQYGVTQPTISRIRTRKNWTHV